MNWIVLSLCAACLSFAAGMCLAVKRGTALLIVAAAVLAGGLAVGAAEHRMFWSFVAAGAPSLAAAGCRRRRTGLYLAVEVMIVFLALAHTEGALLAGSCAAVGLLAASFVLSYSPP